MRPKHSIWKCLLLGYSSQSQIAFLSNCSKQYVNRVCGEMIAESILVKTKKNKVELNDSRKLLFKLAGEWKMPKPMIIDLPLKNREEVSEFFEKIKIEYAFTLTDLSVWVDDSEKLKEYENRKGNIRVYENKEIVKNKKLNGEADNIQLFIDLFSKGGWGIDLALSLGLRKGLL